MNTRNVTKKDRCRIKEKGREPTNEHEHPEPSNESNSERTKI